ncbi:hypothetical protein RGUI_0728 [Rhodovulum sp. P5]|uniref:hypothetical protein n=1 Tax=Rhodovulum sp. P5 TaxID=1564506 RepID=UPI0009C2B3C5|nr:hypothetical protein [Rhodovulum sp. P5]ARE38869.1 hypothetical protein RGUI_0728 [Rhodovulum sp. P5]
MTLRTILAVTLGGAFLAPLAASATTMLPAFNPEAFTGESPVNTYFPLNYTETKVTLATGVDEDGNPFVEKSVQRVVGDGREILGVQTVAIRDSAYENDPGQCL